MAAIVVKGHRPSKKADIPPPLYLTATDTPPSYCYSCGRVVSSRRVKAGKSAASQARYCSDKCKHHKPSSSPTSLDRTIEDALYALLDLKPVAEVAVSLPARLIHENGRAGEADAREIKDTRVHSSKKGEKRIIVPCSLVESIVFGREANTSRGQGRRRERARRIALENDGPELKGDEDYDEAALLATLGRLGTRNSVQPPADKSGIADDQESSSGEGEDDDSSDTDGAAISVDLKPGAETNGDDYTEKRQAGQKRAQQREQVRNACRRAVVFGLLPPGAEEKVPSPDAKDSIEDGNLSDEDDFGKKGRKKSSRAKAKDRNEGHRRQTSKGDGDSPAHGGRRLCEAIMRGDIVEPSFAKGEWGVRWRE